MLASLINLDIVGIQVRPASLRRMGILRSTATWSMKVEDLSAEFTCHQLSASMPTVLTPPSEKKSGGHTDMSIFRARNWIQLKFHARTTMRHELSALQLYFGFPALYATRPFTCSFQFPQAHGSAQALPALGDALFRWWLRPPPSTCMSLCFCAFCLAPIFLPPDRLSRLRVLSPLKVCLVTCTPFIYGVTEPQNRGSLHLQLLVHLAGFSPPKAFICRFIDRLPALLVALRAWAASVQHTSLEAVPATLHSRS